MSITRVLSDALILAGIWYVLTPAPAMAYFDLGTGTYLVQLFLAFGATAWFSVRRVFVRKPKTQPDTPDAEPQVDTDATVRDEGSMRKKKK